MAPVDGSRGFGMLASPAPRYYLVGAVVAAAGALLLLLRFGRRGLSAPHPRGLLAAAVACVAVGAVVFGAGLWIDADYNARLNATTLSYTVSVTMNETDLVQIVLPAPSDARFYDALNLTQGQSSLRLNRSATDTSVLLTAYGNVSLQVIARVPTQPTNWSFTRVLCGYGANWMACNATIGMRAPRSGVRALVQLDMSLGTSCYSTGYEVNSWIATNTADYPAQRIGIVC